MEPENYLCQCSEAKEMAIFLCSGGENDDSDRTLAVK